MTPRLRSLALRCLHHPTAFPVFKLITVVLGEPAIAELGGPMLVVLRALLPPALPEHPVRPGG